MAQQVLEILESALPVAEKFKKVTQLSKQATDSQLDEILESLRKTPDYNGVRIKLVNDFKRSSCVLDILQNGDKQSIALVVKFPWMYADGSDLVNAEFLITTLFPRVSFSTRQKVINNIGKHLKNPQIADHIFDTIESKYGFQTAKAMLQACNDGHIFNLFNAKNENVLSSNQLLSIIQTSPQRVLNYLEHVYSLNSSETYEKDFNPCFKYLLNVDLYRHKALELMINYPWCWDFDLGRRAPKRLWLEHSAECYILMKKKPNFFKPRVLQIFLSSEDYEQAFLEPIRDLKAMLTCSWESENLWKWLDHLPEPRQQALLRNSFKTALSKEITECPQYVTPDMLLLLSNKEKSQIITWKLENASHETVSCRIFKFFGNVYGNCEWFWKSMKPTKDSIPELTKLLTSETDCKKRLDLFTLLIMSCVFNKDIQALKKVLQFLTKRCRNDTPDIRRNLLELIAEATIHFKFDSELWACFQELFQFLKLYEELNHNADFVFELLLKQAAYHQELGKSFEAELNSFIKITLERCYYFDICIIKRLESQREIFESYIKTLSSMAEIAALPSVSHGLIVFLIEQITEWNHSHQRNSSPINVSHYPWLERKCQEILTGENNRERIIAFEALKQTSNLEPEILIMVLRKTVCLPILYYCLKKHSEKIADNVDIIANIILKENDVYNFRPCPVFVRKLRAACSWVLINAIKDKCKTILRCEDSITDASNAIQLLAILEPSSEYLNFVSKYYPMQAKIDPSVPIDELDYRIKASITKSLKYFPDARISLPIVDKFLVGDYLKLTVGSLSSVCLSVPEMEALVYLRSRLKDRPVSMKKHIIRLFFQISPLDGECGVLEELWSAEKNVSIRYELLIQIYKLFVTTSSENVWKLLKSAIESLTDEDMPCLSYVDTSTFIYESLDMFLFEFFQTILETFKRIGVYKTFETSIICHISNHVSKLDGNFLDSLVRDVLYKSRISTEGVYADLAINYLMDNSILPEVQAHRQNVIREIIQDLFDHHWDITEVKYEHTKEDLVFPTRRLFTKICEGICDFLLCHRWIKQHSVEQNILQELAKQLETALDIFDLFELFVYMQLTLIALEVRTGEESDWLKSFGQHASVYLSHNAKEYGGEMTCFICMMLRRVSNLLVRTGSGESILNIIDGLLSDQNDKCHLITAICLLPKKDDEYSGELLETYNHILNFIKDTTDPTVKIYFKLWGKGDRNQIEIFSG